MGKDKTIIYVKPNTNLHSRLKLSDFTEPYINIEALKKLINSKITETQRYDYEVGWNTALRNILNHLNNENI